MNIIWLQNPDCYTRDTGQEVNEIMLSKRNGIVVLSNLILLQNYHSSPTFIATIKLLSALITFNLLHLHNLLLHHHNLLLRHSRPHLHIRHLLASLVSSYFTGIQRKEDLPPPPQPPDPQLPPNEAQPVPPAAAIPPQVPAAQLPYVPGVVET